MVQDVLDRAVAEPALRRHGAPRLLLPTLVVLLFFSGACALVYEQLWLRLLSLVFGVTVYAAAATLASFFAGLALGSYVAGRLVDRTARPLRWYGIAEILIGLSAIATQPALNRVEGLYIGISGGLPDSVAVLTLVRFLLSFLTLLLPATLMGATLPIAVKSALRSGNLGERAGLLYATNTAGAIAGTLVAGFWLIRYLGLNFSFRSGAVVNVLVGLSAIIGSAVWERGLARTSRELESRTRAVESERAASPPVTVPEHARRVVLVVFAVSGFATLALEVVWFRVLVLYVEATTYAFTVMLATVLIGIAVGSYVATLLMRRRADWLRLLALLEIALAFAVLLSLLFLSRTFDIVNVEDSQVTSLRVALIASFLAMLPATLLMGVAFPIGLQIWAAGEDERSEAGRRVGVFYSLNVAGGILGSIVAAFVLVPVLGTRASVILLAALILLAGLLVVAAFARRSRRTVFGSVGIAVFVVTAVVAVPNPYTAALEQRYPGDKLLWQEEGVQTTVSVHQTPDGSRTMYLDGLIQASNPPDGHRAIGALPMALHPNPKEALVIGLGGGATAGIVAAQHGVHVDVVELSYEVVDAAKWFKAENFDIMHRRNVDFRIDDGRNYLLVADKRYDVLTAHIIWPTHAGAGKLWSIEYWRLARDALKDDGVMLQFIGSNQPDRYKLIVRSFLEVFPDATLWGGNLLVGTKKPLQLDQAAFERKLAYPATREALATVGITSFDALLGLYSAGPAELRNFVGDGPLLTDDRPRLEYFVGNESERQSIDLSGLEGGSVTEILKPG